MQKPKIIAVVGPNASGKSSLGILLAKKLNGEIISADSRQVYKGLDIGTGKVTKKEMRGVSHHLLDVVSPKKQFTVDDFVKKAEKICFGILQKTKIPIVVGGTGLYIDMLLGRMSYPAVPPDKKLRTRLERQTTERIFAQLKKLDQRRAETIEPHNKRRLIRAIEVAKGLRRTASATALRAARPSLTVATGSATPTYDVLWIGLNPKNLKQRIKARLKTRMRRGMIAEAKKLHQQGLSYKRMEELGLEYRCLAGYLQGAIRKTELLQKIERGNVQYAKRQMRWFKHNKKIMWVTSTRQAIAHTRRWLAQES